MLIISKNIRCQPLSAQYQRQVIITTHTVLTGKSRNTATIQTKSLSITMKALRVAINLSFHLQVIFVVQGSVESRVGKNGIYEHQIRSATSQMTWNEKYKWISSTKALAANKAKCVTCYFLNIKRIRLLGIQLLVAIENQSMVQWLGGTHQWVCIVIYFYIFYLNGKQCICNKLGFSECNF